MQVLGITGGIACGKSFVTSLFATWGAWTASADEDARAVVAPDSPTLAGVFARFPDVRTPQGTVARAALARQIFADTAARLALEAILHPAIYARMEATVRAARESSSAPLLVYEVPLLYEKQREYLFDAVVAVICSPATQAARLQERERLAGRPPLTAAQIADRLAAQLPLAEKARRADFVVTTDGTTADTEEQVRALWRTLTGSDAPQSAV